MLVVACSPAEEKSTRVQEPIDEQIAGRFAGLALECVHKEYPNKIGHTLSGDEDVGPPRELTPAFFGCFDWHSSVHGHWLLVRLARLVPEAGFASAAVDAVAASLTVENIAKEVDYLSAAGRAAFERPYGLAWLLQLAAELRQWDDPVARRLTANLMPLESLAASRFREWLPKLSHPIRTGEHSQTAFALGLVLDWSRIAGDRDLEQLVKSRSKFWYGDDVNCPIAYEPSGQDFLSPCLAEADLMRRVFDLEYFGDWLADFMPEITGDAMDGWLMPEIVTDPTDGKLAHLDGLNLSRAWMLDGISSALPESDPRKSFLDNSSQLHATAGLASVTGEHYEGGHWLGSFATYLVTRRGIPDGL
ncbi:MAG: DUF2891 domain-containing protein [Gammaproteobacteria bacterium]